MLLRLILVVSLVLSGLAFVPAKPAVAAEPVWWNASYTHRLPINVRANDALVTGYTLDVIFNHASMVSQGASSASGNDLRIARFDGTNWTELDRVFGWGSGPNLTNTALVFKTAAAVTASTDDASYWLYYGNPGATAPPANANNVYVLWDDFSSGTIDSAKWNLYADGDGISVSQSGGALTILGAADSGTQNAFKGLSTATLYGANLRTDVSLRIPTIPAPTWRATVGYSTSFFGLYSNTGGYKRVQATGGVDLASSTISSTSTATQRLSTTFASDGTLRYFENGVQALMLTGQNPSTRQRYFTFAPNVASTSFVAQFDDVAIRQFVTNEPVVTIAQANDVTVVASIAPIFGFTVASASGACNGVTMTAASSATSVSLSGLTSGANVVGGQQLSVVMNAGGGFRVGVWSSGTLSDGRGNSIANVTAVNAAPAAFPAAGTAAFGYTTNDLTLSATGNGVSRFSASRFARFSGTSNEVMSSSSLLNESSCVAVQAGAASNTPAGGYSTTITYSAVPYF